ncbi:hypothetical protein ATCV1_z659R [Acanthocystis turfacea chlorella virus 1]|uniref:Uncharacterized protein z659R n=1 Tax=Chlorovirus heliozoae TaxID=322019 RepID=A7K9R9_9PHYC|nr:hypothetical protein ATCV1_z659R [Acanthocystis turfacea chlorella virus 1]ABT16793.1 hypothetical protein ATCV1_z659R [Acanthocystis turfacea chlorella virus 1]
MHWGQDGAGPFLTGCSGFPQIHREMSRSAGKVLLSIWRFLRTTFYFIYVNIIFISPKRMQALTRCPLA